MFGIATILLIVINAASVAAAPAGGTLADLYRSGRVVLRADEDWTPSLPSDFVFEGRGDLAMAPDGSVFISNTTRHMIYKFGPDGKFVRAFGRQGQGPGDLTFPGRLSILDGKYLVVGEYATNQRISLFDLDGTFVKIVSTGRFTSQAIGLRDGKIAYVSTKGRMTQDEMVNIFEVWIIDSASGAQKSVISHEVRNPMKRMPGGGIVMAASGAAVLARTRDGGLVVGTTQKSLLEMFSADGTRLRTIDCGWKPIPVTAQYRKKYIALMNRRAEAEGERPLPDDPLLPDVLEVLQDVWTDGEGNILVVRKTDCLEDCPLTAKAFSPEGEGLGEVVFEPGPFVLSADWRFKRILLTGRGFYGLLEFKDDPDGYLHLVRADLR